MNFYWVYIENCVNGQPCFSLRLSAGSLEQLAVLLFGDTWAVSEWRFVLLFRWEEIQSSMPMWGYHERHETCSHCAGCQNKALHNGICLKGKRSPSLLSVVVALFPLTRNKIRLWCFVKWKTTFLPKQLFYLIKQYHVTVSMFSFVLFI